MRSSIAGRLICIAHGRLPLGAGSLIYGYHAVLGQEWRGNDTLHGGQPEAGRAGNGDDGRDGWMCVIEARHRVTKPLPGHERNGDLSCESIRTALPEGCPSHDSLRWHACSWGGMWSLVVVLLWPPFSPGRAAFETGIAAALRDTPGTSPPSTLAPNRFQP